jgi:aspartyl/glutamyl-tRNA(Asn/Gln) amidotransferase C subunit
MDKTVDADMVRHIGKLSRIELTDRQVATVRGQIESILRYFDKLQELDTSNVEPMAHAVELRNVFGEDSPRASLTSAEALANAPQRDGDFFRVPKVIEDG